MDNDQPFHYTYSAAQRQEVEAIRQKYLPQEENKLEKLRRLHHCPTRKAQAAALTLGIIGSLILGTGMSLCMTELGTLLGELGMPVGILTGFGGLVLSALAWPVYKRVLKRERRRIAPEILRLSEELMQ